VAAPPPGIAEAGPAGRYADPAEITAGVGREPLSGGAGRAAGDAWGTDGLIGVTDGGRPCAAVETADGAVGTMNVLPHDLQRVVWPAAVWGSFWLVLQKGQEISFMAVDSRAERLRAGEARLTGEYV
jgi:hypothetical protein